MAAAALFDRPLRRDPVLRTWCAVLVVLGVLVLDGNTTWSGSVEADRVAGFLGDLLQVSLLGFLVLALLPAWVRRASRGAGGVPAGEGCPDSLGHRDSAPGDEADDDEVNDEADGRGAGPMPANPRFLDLRVEGNPAAPGLTTRISWQTSGAASVTVDGRRGLPPTGAHEVQLTGPREIALVAHGASGATQSRTVRVGFLTLPQLAKVSLPAGPGVSLRTSVSLLSGAGAPALSTVDAVLAGHDLTRAALAPPAAGRLSGTDLASLARLALDVSWMRGARSRSFDPLHSSPRNETTT